MNILVVEDDWAMQRLLATYLTARGYQVHAAASGREALDAIMSGSVDLVLLDIYLPGEMDGIEVCRRARSATSVPIILVTAAERTDTKVRALDLGGDDYVTKPFNAEELMARIRSVLRRAHTGSQQSTSLQVGDLAVDAAAREVRRRGTAIGLTRIEFELLMALVHNVGRTLTYQQILRAVWGPGYDDIHLVHVHMSNLRSKLGDGQAGLPRILAVAGVGYRLRADGPQPSMPQPPGPHFASSAA